MNKSLIINIASFREGEITLYKLFTIVFLAVYQDYPKLSLKVFKYPLTKFYFYLLINLRLILFIHKS